MQAASGAAERVPVSAVVQAVAEPALAGDLVEAELDLVIVPESVAERELVIDQVLGPGSVTGQVEVSAIVPELVTGQEGAPVIVPELVTALESVIGRVVAPALAIDLESVIARELVTGLESVIAPGSQIALGSVTALIDPSLVAAITLTSATSTIVPITMAIGIMVTGTITGTIPGLTIPGPGAGERDL